MLQNGPWSNNVNRQDDCGNVGLFLSLTESCVHTYIMMITYQAQLTCSHALCYISVCFAGYTERLRQKLSTIMMEPFLGRTWSCVRNAALLCESLSLFVSSPLSPALSLCIGEFKQLKCCGSDEMPCSSTRREWKTACDEIFKYTHQV